MTFQCVFWVDVGLFFVAFSRNMGSYHQRSERFLTRNNTESHISIIGRRPSATPLYDIGVEIRPTKSKKKYFASDQLSLGWCTFSLIFVVLIIGNSSLESDSLTDFRYTAPMPRASSSTATAAATSSPDRGYQLRLDEGVAPMSNSTPVNRSDYGNRRSATTDRTSSGYRYWIVYRQDSFANTKLSEAFFSKSVKP